MTMLDYAVESCRTLMTVSFESVLKSGKRTERGDAMEKGIKKLEGKNHEKQPLVSVIMPVYNAEKYVGEAIESVLSQTYPCFELLLINDASSDDSGSICKEYKKKDNRIVLLENLSKDHGPGPTRNIGLDYAKGKFIYFMDADDWVEKDLLEAAVKRLQETGADLVQFGLIQEHGDGKTSAYCWEGKDVLTKEEIGKDFLYFWKNNRSNLWLHFFRREVVDTIRFENILCGEDICYVADALSNSEKIAYISRILYYYRYVEKSTSHRWTENIIECREKIWNHQKAFLDSFQKDDNKLACTELAYDNFIWAIYQMSSPICRLSFREKKRELLVLKDKMKFEQYRNMYTLVNHQGIQKIKYMLVKCHLENLLLLLGPFFLRVVRGSRMKENSDDIIR